MLHEHGDDAEHSQQWPVRLISEYAGEHHDLGDYLDCHVTESGHQTYSLPCYGGVTDVRNGIELALDGWVVECGDV